MKLLRLVPLLLTVACSSSPERRAAQAGAQDAREDTTSDQSPARLADHPVASTRVDAAPADGVVVSIDYRATPENEQVIDTLLTEGSIPFHLEAVRSNGWAPVVVRLYVTVRQADLERAGVLLRAAETEGRLEAIEGIRDLISRF